MKLDLSASCLPGMEGLLLRELEFLGARQLRQEFQAVRFEADEQVLIRCIHESRCALRIFQKIGEYAPGSLSQLEKKLASVKWDSFLSLSQSFAVETVEAGGRAPGALQFISLKVKDSIVDVFRKSQGARPDVQRQNPDVRFLLVFGREHTMLYREASGYPLSQRGYRRQHGGAPINEALAWGILETAGFSMKVGRIPGRMRGILIDPMCGSGTFSIEAARYLKFTGVKACGEAARDPVPPDHGESESSPGRRQAVIPPRGPKQEQTGRVLLVKKDRDKEERSAFACLQWADLTEAMQKAYQSYAPKAHNSDRGSWIIIAADRDERVLDIARENARRAGVYEYISFIHSDFENLRSDPRIEPLVTAAMSHQAEPGIIVLNPPYDMRLGSENLEADYRNIGDVLKNDWRGFEAHVFSAKRSALKQIGLRSSSRHSFKTGQLDAALFSYSLY